MLHKNTAKRPDIDELLTNPIIINKIKGLICQTLIKKEFNQTMVQKIGNGTYMQIPLDDKNIKHYIKIPSETNIKSKYTPNKLINIPNK